MTKYAKRGESGLPPESAGPTMPVRLAESDDDPIQGRADRDEFHVGMGADYRRDDYGPYGYDDDDDFDDVPPGYPANYSPGRYPPDRYPPGRYPPDQYPPDRYPPDRYAPDRYPPDAYPPDRYPQRDYPGYDYGPDGYDGADGYDDYEGYDGDVRHRAGHRDDVYEDGYRDDYESAGHPDDGEVRRIWREDHEPTGSQSRIRLADADFSAADTRTEFGTGSLAEEYNPQWVADPDEAAADVAAVDVPAVAVAAPEQAKRPEPSTKREHSGRASKRSEPGAGESPVPDQEGDERWAAASYVTAALFSVLPPLAIYLINRRSSHFVRLHAAQACNAAVTMLLYGVSAVVVCALLLLDSPYAGIVIAGGGLFGLWLIWLAFLARSALAALAGGYKAMPVWLCEPFLRG